MTLAPQLLNIVMAQAGWIFRGVHSNMKKYLSFIALLLTLAAPQTAWAVANGDACSSTTPAIAVGGSYIDTTGSGASTVYIKYICKDTSVFQEVERWTVGGRSNFNIGTDSTAVLNAACTQTGRLSYNSSSSTPWLYCTGSVWSEFSLIPLTSDLTCWGMNKYELQAEYSPYKFKNIEHANARLCGLIANNRPVCVGAEEYTVPFSSPVNTINVDAANGYACIINSAGTIKCYNVDGIENPIQGMSDSLFSQGSNPFGGWSYLAGPPTSGGYIDVSTAGNAGPEQQDNYTCAVKNDGSVSCWNWRPDWGIDPPALTDAIAVEVEGPNNSNHDRSSGCALRSGGSLSCWGFYGSYPSPNSGFTLIRTNGAGTYCGRRNTGSIDCWGDNVPSGISALTDVVDVAVSSTWHGGTTVCALRTGGVVSCWGDNTHNKITDAPSSGAFTMIASLGSAFCVK